MPYITQNRRDALDPLIEALAKQLHFMMMPPESREGDLNYAISKLLQAMYPVQKYSEYNAAYGMLQCCATEFYRTVIAPYEDQKKFENGEV
jgi:hypothetical protein